MLLEFYYDDPAANKRAGQPREKLLRAITNFFRDAEDASSFVERCLPATTVSRIAFPWKRSMIFALKDKWTLLGARRGVQVVDWKIGSSTGNHDSLQLVTYGWWAAKEFGVDPTSVRVRQVFFLGDPIIEESCWLTETLLRRGKARIIQDVRTYEGSG